MNSGDRERLAAQVEQILAADEDQRSYDNALNDVFRKSSFERDNKDMTVVVKVVQQVTMVDNGRQMDLYKQDLVIANRGKDKTKTVMGTLLSPVSNQLY
jgi:Skp family chaperone for outer membrane proteins